MKKELLTITRETSELTPIEIALGVDEHGLTTAKKLYEFLELNPGNYARWCKGNILDNPFAEEGKDYYSSCVKSEGKGNFADDFKLDANFAKKLSMAARNERGNQAQEYFVQVEKSLKKSVSLFRKEFEEMRVAFKKVLEENNAIKKRVAELEEDYQRLEMLRRLEHNVHIEESAELTVAKQFLQVLDKVLSDEEYCYAIKPRGYHGSMEVIGIYDDRHVLLTKLQTYGIYEHFADFPVSQKILWNILAQAGYVDVMFDSSKKISVGYRPQACIALHRAKVEFLIKNRE